MGAFLNALHEAMGPTEWDKYEKGWVCEPREKVRASVAEIKAADTVGYFYPYSHVELRVVFVHNQLVVDCDNPGPYVVYYAFAQSSPGGVLTQEVWRDANLIATTFINGRGVRIGVFPKQYRLSESGGAS